MIFLHHKNTTINTAPRKEWEMRSNKPFLKSQSIFPMKSSTSMEVPAHKIEFPSYPQTAVGEEITHYTHSHHPLTQVTLRELFTCSGCKEYGAGSRFVCRHCDFQLHDFCIFSPQLLKDHPLHGQHQLVFYSKSKTGITWTKCDVCGKSTKGFTFRCSACSFQMHPCCAMLSTDISFSSHPHLLKLQSPIQNGAVACGQCNKKSTSGRIYACTVCDYHLHAVCAKAFINGLQANGIPTPEKPTALGTAARFASLVVVEFIGGLIDGLGEGIGEVLIQNIARGRCITSNRRRMQ